MRVRHLSVLAAAAAAVAGLAGTASAAISVTQSQLLNGYTGPITIHINGFSSGTSYPLGGVAHSAGYAAGAVNDTAAATSMNGVALQTPPPGGQLASPSGLGTEDSWGIFTIDTIKDDAGHTLFSNGQLVNGHTVELKGVYFGVVDTSLFDTGGSFGIQQVLGKGFQAAIYLEQDGYPSHKFPYPDNSTEFTRRTGQDKYAGISDGTSVAPVWTIGADPVFANGQDVQVIQSYGAGGSLLTLSGNVLGEPRAVGSALDVGIWNNLLVGGPSSVAINWNLDRTNSPGKFSLAFSDPITASAIPEPGSLTLLGLAALGLVRMRRHHA